MTVDYETHSAHRLAEVTDGLGRKWLMSAGDVGAFLFARDPDARNRLPINANPRPLFWVDDTVVYESTPTGVRFNPFDKLPSWPMRWEQEGFPAPLRLARYRKD